MAAEAVAAAPDAAAKAIFVTGGNSGIGLALCQQLLADFGCRVFMGSRDVAKGEAALQSLELAEDVAKRCTVVQCDVGSDDSVNGAARATSGLLEGSRLYALVNNAGTGIAHKPTDQAMVDTNLYGPKRVSEAFIPLLDEAVGRIVNVGSGAGPMYVGSLGETDEARMLMNGEASWEQIEEYAQGKLKGEITGKMGAYGLSKACLHAYTQQLAKANPKLMISVCTPGFIDTALSKGDGATKPPSEGTVAIKKLLFDALEGSGRYYGSDGVRSPYHAMRSPGQPAYDGTLPF